MRPFASPLWTVETFQYRQVIPAIRIIIRNLIPPLIEEVVYHHLTSLHKAMILLGARQVGKTTWLLALQKRLEREGKAVRYLNCDLEEERQAANTTFSTLLDRLVAGKDALFILNV